MAEQEKKLAAFTVQCGDGTGGRVSAESPAEARAMAEEMCDVHNGIKEAPKPRT